MSNKLSMASRSEGAVTVAERHSDASAPWLRACLANTAGVSLNGSKLSVSKRTRSSRPRLRISCCKNANPDALVRQMVSQRVYNNVTKVV